MGWGRTGRTGQAGRTAPLLGPVALVLLLGAAVPDSISAQDRLPNLTVSGKTPCRVHPESARETADLWETARTILEATVRTDSAPPTLLIREWERTLDFRLRVRYERSDTSEVKSRNPFFNKAAPSNLERVGYIQRQGWSVVYIGPGPRLLLSERFLRSHCFGKVAGEGANAGLVGLTFDPLPRTTIPDVRGVLWIDPVQGELRSMEYTWINPPPEARAPAIGGWAHFARVGSAGWMVQRWNLRTARPEGGYTRGFDGYTDHGGEVIAIVSPSPTP